MRNTTREEKGESSATGERVAMQTEWDVLVVGGGINGAGIARDLAGRGVRVLLVEQGDLAQHTSSASTKLIHGGLRYLEHWQFDLVRKALREREVLLSIAPHLIAPLRFVMPHVPELRPAWMIRAGLFLYDHLSGRAVLEASCGVNLCTHEAGEPLVDGLKRGFMYSDACVDDARLVVLNALCASERGATIRTRTRLVSAIRGLHNWQARLSDVTGHLYDVTARVLVNAAGPWVNALPTDGRLPARPMRLVKGSHIVTARLFDHEHAYLFQNHDRRIVFAIPWKQDYTLIGTTEIDYSGSPAEVRISTEEIEYLCDAVNRYFYRKINAGDVVWSYAGVRPLLEDSSDDASSTTRDYQLELDMTRAPLMSVYGGKITIYRKLAEEVAEQLALPLSLTRPAWTHHTSLPGGDMLHRNFGRFLADFSARYPFIPASLAYRYARAYGTRAERFLEGATSLDALGKMIVPGLYEAEAHYLLDHEWATCAEDILWRRTKLGLKATPEDHALLDAWIAERLEIARHETSA